MYISFYYLLAIWDIKNYRILYSVLDLLQAQNPWGMVQTLLAQSYLLGEQEKHQIRWPQLLREVCRDCMFGISVLTGL